MRPYIDALTLALIGVDGHYLVQPRREVAGSIRRITLCYIPVETGNNLPAVEIHRMLSASYQDRPLRMYIGYMGVF